jgi:CRP-like cAMP-binding protein
MRTERGGRARIEERALAAIAAEGRERTLTSHERISLEGPSLTVVLAGYLRVFRHAAFVRDVSLYLAARGDPLGIERVLRERPIETGAEALGPARIVAVPLDALERHAAADPAIYLDAAAVLATRTLRVLEQLDAYGHASVASRVARTLLRLAEDHGVPAPEGTRLDLPLSQEDLAALTGVTRESCSSTVAAFARQGIVRGPRLKGLVILDFDGLRAQLTGVDPLI